MLRRLHWTRRSFLSDEQRRLADGRYELFEAIGSGGMATVYRAQDHRLGVARAIKVLLPDYASKDRVRARFEAEARTMAVLDHPNIVRVYDVGATSETAWIVMELVEGSSMLAHIGDFGMSVEDCLKVGVGIAAALQSAHAHGVVHRDIKPHNVLMSTEGTVRITDFGIARSAGLSEDSFTKTGTVMGTWAFMAPEQRVNAKSVDHTADIYGAGATLFAMATGQTPMDLFAADLDPAMLNKVPDPLVPIIRKATRYNREERYPDARSLLIALEGVRDDLGIQTDTMKDPAIRPPSTAPATTQPIDQSIAKTSQGSLPTNVTYVDTDVAEVPADPAPAKPDSNHTPLPYRPAASARPVSDAPPDGMAQQPNRRLRARDKVAVGAAVALIGFLLVGGFWKRSASDAPVPTAENNRPTEQQPIVASGNERTDPERSTAAPEVAPEPEGYAQDPAPARPAAAAGTPATARPVASVTNDQGARSVSEVQAPAVPQTPTETLEEATGVVPTSDPDQPAAKPNAPDDALAKSVPKALAVPVIEHTPVSVARMGSQMPLTVRILNLTPLETQTYRVTVYFRSAETAQYRPVTLGRNRSTWVGSVPVTAAMERGVEYFIRAESTADDTTRLKRLKSGSNLRPHRVRVSSP